MIRTTLVALLLAASVQAQTKVPVYVTAPVDENGYALANKQISESVADLQKAIRESKTLALANTKADARLVLTVVQRSVTWQEDGVTSTYHPYTHTRTTEPSRHEVARLITTL